MKKSYQVIAPTSNLVSERKLFEILKVTPRSYSEVVSRKKVASKWVFSGQTDRQTDGHFPLDPKHTEMVGYGDFEMKKNEHDCLKSDRDFSRKMM